jgi:C1A family cysteine protease
MEMQQNDSSAEYTINQFTDLTVEEFSAKYLGITDNSEEHISNQTFTNSTIPSSIDWRQQGKVTPIKNQKNCGACWAFASTQAIESHYAIKYNKLVELSQQQIIDCDKVGHGCHGGFHFEALDYVKRQGGIMSEDDYKYEEKKGECRFNENKVVAKVASYLNVTSDENEMARAVAEIGPIVVGADAQWWQFYWRGIADPRLCSDVNNHAVLIVGYGEERGKQYWIIKNSWGERWGEKGYMRLIRGKNKCGVSKRPSYPIIE